MKIDDLLNNYDYSGDYELERYFLLEKIVEFNLKDIEEIIESIKMRKSYSDGINYVLSRISKKERKRYEEIVEAEKRNLFS